MDIFGMTHIGKIRQTNQDNYYIHALPSDRQAVALICDGMGGAKAGNVASEFAMLAFSEEIKNMLKPAMSVEYMKNILKSAVRIANSKTYEKSLESPDYEGMGTTIVAVLTDGDNAVIANVGDSRAYMIHDERIQKITRDHSLVEDMISRGERTPEEAKDYPGKNLITRALGTENSVSCDLFEVLTTDMDALLLCSDGLTNVVSEDEILHIVNKEKDAAKCCEALIRAANSAGGPDNISVILLIP